MDRTSVTMHAMPCASPTMLVHAAKVRPVVREGQYEPKTKGPSPHEHIIEALERRRVDRDGARASVPVLKCRAKVSPAADVQKRPHSNNCKIFSRCTFPCIVHLHVQEKRKGDACAVARPQRVNMLQQQQHSSP